MKFLLGLIKKVIHEHTIPVRLDGISRILVVDLNYIGDMLFSSPIYKALKKTFPNAEVAAVVYRFTKEVVSANPYVDRVYDLPKGNLFRQLGPLLRLRKSKSDLVLQLNTSLRTNFLMWIIDSKYRLGYDYQNRGCFNNIRIPIATRTSRTRYRIDECADLLEQAFGWEVADREMVLHVDDQYKLKVAEVLDRYDVKASDTLIGIQANCRETWKERRWEQSKFAALANELIERYAARIVFTGSKDDAEYVRAIVQKIRRSDNIINLVGGTTLMELAALLQRIHVFVTVNTGPMQIAISQRTPTVVLMGVTPPLITYPMNVPIFQYVWLGDHATSSQLAVDSKDSMRMKSIEVYHVMDKVNYLLELRGKTV
jgi:ADP-heptose:LPS heptosyltransferase